MLHPERIKHIEINLALSFAHYFFTKLNFLVVVHFFHSGKREFVAIFLFAHETNRINKIIIEVEDRRVAVERTEAVVGIDLFQHPLVRSEIAVVKQQVFLLICMRSAISSMVMSKPKSLNISRILSITFCRLIICHLRKLLAFSSVSIVP